MMTKNGNEANDRDERIWRLSLNCFRRRSRRMERAGFKRRRRWIEEMVLKDVGHKGGVKIGKKGG